MGSTGKYAYGKWEVQIKHGLLYDWYHIRGGYRILEGGVGVFQVTVIVNY